MYAVVSCRGARIPCGILLCALLKPVTAATYHTPKRRLEAERPSRFNGSRTTDRLHMISLLHQPLKSSSCTLDRMEWRGYFHEFSPTRGSSAFVFARQTAIPGHSSAVAL